MPRFARRRWMAGLRALNGQWRMLALADAARGGVACAVPALLAALCQQPLLCWSAIAAFWTCLADEPELDRAVRARKGLVFGLLGGLASGIAIASRAVPLLPPLLAAAVVWLCALERRRGPAAGMRGLLVATSFAISAVFSVQGWAAGAQYFAYFLAGGAWAAACQALLWQTGAAPRAVRAGTRYFACAARFARCLAARSLSRPAPVGTGRRQLRSHLDAFETAAERVAGVAVIDRWRMPAARLLAQLAGLESLVEHAMPANAKARSAAWMAPPLRRLAAILDGNANALAHGLPVDDAAAARLRRAVAASRARFDACDAAAIRAWGHACLDVLDRMASTLCPAAGVPEQARACRAATAPAATPQHAHGARLALATGIAVALAAHCSLRQGQWLVLTVLFTMQPQVASTLQVSLQRMGGTVAGAVLAILLGLAIPHKPLLACAILPLAICALASRPLSYGSFTLFLTPHFILVADLASTALPPWQLAAWRVVDSLGGVLLGMAISMMAWPSWEHRSLATTARDAAHKVLGYVACAQALEAPPSVAAVQRAAALRREACLAVDKLEALVDRLRYEPFAPAHARATGRRAVAHLRALTGMATLLEDAGHPQVTPAPSPCRP
ncbi:FUSC family protein [Massilia sp. TN1-12]|uniref:FUSC family protein n=1 Tax=Massilia paldalensis TaxID=3377675 RepID=UPI0038504F63